MLKVAYFGLPLGAHLLMRDGHELNPCVLSPLEAPGRRRVAARVPTAHLFEARGRAPANFAREIERALGQARPELIVSWFWTRLLPAAWLSAARFGGVGVHPSLLPRHRGPNPYFWTIDSGDLRAGVTLHALAPEYDAGAILLQRSLLVGTRNSWQLARALDRPSLALLREGVRCFAEGRPPAESEQREATVSWAPEPTGRELLVEWTWSTERVLRRIRALAPVPGLAVEIQQLRFFVTRAREATHFVAALEPGEATVLGEAETLVIRTADGAVAVERALISSGEPDGLGEDPAANDESPADRELDERALAAAVEERLAGPARSA